MTSWRADIYQPNGAWWGTAYGETPDLLRRNTDGLLIKLVGMEELERILKEKEDGKG